MNGDKLLNGLDLDYHLRVDDKIWPKPQVNYFAIVFNGYWPGNTNHPITFAFR